MTYGDKFIATICNYSIYLPNILKSLIFKKYKIEKSKIITKMWKKEALNVAKILNATPYFLGFEDTKVPNFNNRIALIKLINFIRTIRLTIIFTHWYNEFHSDHKNTSNLIIMSHILSDNPKIKTNSLLYKAKLLVFWDERGKNFKPNYFLDVSNYIYGF